MSYFIIGFLFLAWRIFLLLPLVVSQIFLSPRAGYGYTMLPYFLDKSNKILHNFLIYPFANFDGAYYLLIAAKGYTVNVGFFPLFPLSIHILTLPFNILPFDPIQYSLASILVAVYFFISLIIFYKLLKLDYPKNTAIWAIVFLLIFPTSFFYASIYSESLSLLLTVLSFYFARKKRWLLAGIFAGLSSATRIVGIALFPALLYEYFKANKNKFTVNALSLFLAPIGLLTYAFYNFAKWGNAFYFIQAQGNFQNNRTVDSIVFLPQAIFRYLKMLMTVNPTLHEWKLAFFELSFFIFTLVILCIAWKKKIRVSYLIFGLFCLLMPSLTGTLSGIPRYVLVIFPLFITLALIKNKLFKIVYSVISITLLFIFFMLFSKGYFIA